MVQINYSFVIGNLNCRQQGQSLIEAVENIGTLYPALLKLEQEGAIEAEWGVSENNRKAKFYKLTRTGRRQLMRETKNWEQTTAIVARFLAPADEVE